MKDTLTEHFQLRREKYVWFVALLAGNTAAYACRTTMPLVSPVIAKDLSWSKTEAGTVLSSFFWGYALTQVVTHAEVFVHIFHSKTCEKKTAINHHGATVSVKVILDTFLVVQPLNQDTPFHRF